MTDDNKPTALWLFPESDFPRWLATCHQGGYVRTYRQYLRQLDMLKQSATAQGYACVRREMTVQAMLDALAARGWPNETQYRAAVIAGGDALPEPPDRSDTK